MGQAGSTHYLPTMPHLNGQAAEAAAPAAPRRAPRGTATHGALGHPPRRCHPLLPPPQVPLKVGGEVVFGDSNLAAFRLDLVADAAPTSSTAAAPAGAKGEPRGMGRRRAGHVQRVQQ